MTGPLGIGLVGAGGFARFLAGAIADLPDVRLVAVADSDPSRAADLAATVDARAVPRWEDLVATGDVARAVRHRFDLMTEVLGLDRRRAVGWTLARVLQNLLWALHSPGASPWAARDRVVARALLARR